MLKIEISSKDLKEGRDYSEQTLVRKITAPDKENSGAYRCVTKFRESVWPTELRTLVFAYEVVPSTIESIKTYLRREANFYCEIYGNKPSKITWRKDQTIISALNTQSYEIYIKNKDSSEYHLVTSESDINLAWNGTVVRRESRLTIKPEGTNKAETAKFHCVVKWGDISSSTSFNLQVYGKL